ncbi:prolyl oligopeptidase family serine peptidase [Chryseobacterium rhizoplanae]|uniref:prolyl oligopeptidase family serine peptidase n=1 Tax=Chryseobacterium rhizoplanae TaxID=1609531 RepID=UPI001CE2EEC6|nr:prolyl oligopeptidase family serine peptidase [Chryseobacterium rhizoplanae]UCA60124.1 prolyl oligopeptidase family serine peptidase [Chryseobacterium rhizoplanae]
MKHLVFIVVIFFFFDVQAQLSNLAPSKPATDIYFGSEVVDDYRNFENLHDPKVLEWMRSQTIYTNSVLDKIPNRNYYVEKRLELDKKQGFSISDLKITNNNKYFYLKKTAEEKTAKVYYRNNFNGQETLLYDPSNAGNKDVVTLISPSWDGNKLAISLSEKGKEISRIIIMDVKSKSIYPQTITQTNASSVGGIKWLGDSSGFFYIYYPVVDITSNLFGKNTQSVLYKLGDDPNKRNDIFSSSNNPDLKISNDVAPAILTFNSDDQYYIGMLVDAEDFRKTYIIEKNDLLNNKKNWKKLYDKTDKIFYIRLFGNDLYFLSGYNSPNFKLCRTNIKNPDFKNPEVLVSEKKDEVIGGYAINRDGIYFTTIKNGVEAKLYQKKDGKEISIKLPYASGSINLQSRGKDFSDLWITCSGWINEEQRFRYNLSNTFIPENLSPIMEYPEFKDISVEELTIKSRDGKEIPLSLIYNKNFIKNGSNPTLIDAYGAYGNSRSPFFAKSYLLWVNQGGIVAIAHVRGGGEKGETWHLDGFKDTKFNSWRDLIDCTEYLIKKGYTSKDKTAIWGTSAGGITIGRAMTERPDLFKAAIVEVGMTNMLRFENTPNGEGNIKEFGTVKKPEEFKNLLEMDAYHHIKKGVKYPATFITGGINDNRVIVWQPAKFAAKLMASNISKNPILLKIDYEGGHGNNVPIAQRYSSLSDIFAFALWQLGHPDYQPKENTQK